MFRLSKLAITTACALTLLPAVSVAQASPPPSALPLGEAVQMALHRNFRVAIAGVERDAALEGVRVEAGRFDPILGASAYTFDEFFDTTATQAYQVDGQTADVKVSGLLPTGTTYSVGVQTERYADSAPARETRLVAQVNQPLLRGMGFGPNLASLRIARKDAAISAKGLSQSVVDVVTETQFAYFDALLAQNNLWVSEESLTLARRLLEENRERAKLGILAESDLLQAEADVAAREERLHDARQMQVDAFHNLRRLITGELQGVLDWDVQLMDLPPPEFVEVDARADYVQALQLRPDYQQAVLGLDRAQIEQLRASNARLPELDLVGRATLRADGGSLRDTLSHLDDDADDPAYSVGLVFSMPIPNRSARAQAMQASLATRRQELTLRQFERDILLTMDAAAARIHNGWARLQSARRSRELAERALEAEQQRFQIGTSTTFVLIQLQGDLSNARVRELVVINEYRKAAVEYERQSGRTLASLGIQVQDE